MLDTATYHRDVHLPENVWRTIEIGVERLGPERVLLYGSRARGSHRAGSDWDIAFDGEFAEEAFARYRSDMDEDGPTFLPLDLADLRRVPDGLRASILRDGRLLYSRT